MTIKRYLARWLRPQPSFTDDFQDARSRGCYTGHWGTSAFYIDGDHHMYVGTGALQGRLYDVIGPNRTRDLDTLAFRGPVRAPQDSSQLLSGTDEIYTSECAYLRNIRGLDRLDTSQVTNMYGMFANDRFVDTLDLSSWDVSHVRDLSLVFHNLVSLEHLRVDTWDTQQVQRMRGTFDGDHSLSHLDVDTWDTRHVRDMAWMFTDDTKLSRLDLRHFDMSNVEDTNAMFLWMSPHTRVYINPTFSLMKASAIQDEDVISERS